MSRTVTISAGYADKTSKDYNSTRDSIHLELDARINGSSKEIDEASEYRIVYRRSARHEATLTTGRLQTHVNDGDQIFKRAGGRGENSVH